MTEAVRREAPDCAGCGAELPLGEGLRDVQCAHCQLRQPHPRPLSVGQVVMIPGALALAVGRVVACEGADQVTVQPEKGPPKILALEGVIPVVRGLDAQPPAAPNERVFARSVHGFELTWLSAIGGLSAVVKHPKAGFQSAFFDRQVPASDVYVALRPERRERRSGPGWDVGDTIVKAVRVVHGAVFAVFTLFFMLVMGAVVLAVLRAWLS